MRVSVVLIALMIGALACAPLFVSGYYLYLLNVVFVNVILALGLNILMGEAGLFALAHAAFYGIGIYSAGLLTNRLGVPIPIGMLAGGIVAAALGYVIGRISVRLRDIYLALSTFAFAQAAHWVFVNWTSVTGGPNGFRLKPANFFGFEMINDRDAYYFVMASCLVFVWLSIAIGRSGFGRAMRAIRESEPAAAAVGIDVPRTKAIAFAISAFFAGCAGGVFSSFFSYVHPEQLDFNLTVVILSMLVVGGIGTIGGPIVGAIALGLLAEVLRRTTAYQEVLYGAILILFMIFAPNGLAGVWALIRARRGAHG